MHDSLKFYQSRFRSDGMTFSRYKDHTYGGKRFAEQPETAPVHGGYGGLLFDKRWKVKRAEILERDGFRCVICKHTEDLQVHHRQYHFIKVLEQFKAPWDYENHLMVTLCERCHSKGHSQYKVPSVYV